MSLMFRVERCKGLNRNYLDGGSAYMKVWWGWWIRFVQFSSWYLGMKQGSPQLRIELVFSRKRISQLSFAAALSWVHGGQSSSAKSRLQVHEPICAPYETRAQATRPLLHLLLGSFYSDMVWPPPSWLPEHQLIKGHVVLYHWWSQ